MIHERANSVLTDSEVQELEAKEPAQIELIMRSMYVLKKASFFEVSKEIDRLGMYVHEASVKRALTDLCGAEHQDRYGNSFLIFDKTDRRKNPYTGKTCGTYKLNPDFGFKKPDQVDMFSGVL